jgi:myo-inositol-1(or 4)-monophosphatase
VAAGSLLVTEAGGLVGNFTGEADFLEQKECLAGNPRVYGQMVSDPRQIQQVRQCRRKGRGPPSAADGGGAGDVRDEEGPDAAESGSLAKDDDAPF